LAQFKARASGCKVVKSAFYWDSSRKVGIKFEKSGGIVSLAGSCESHFRNQLYAKPDEHTRIGTTLLPDRRLSRRVTAASDTPPV